MLACVCQPEPVRSALSRRKMGELTHGRTEIAPGSNAFPADLQSADIPECPKTYHRLETQLSAVSKNSHSPFLSPNLLCLHCYLRNRRGMNSPTHSTFVESLASPRHENSCLAICHEVCQPCARTCAIAARFCLAERLNNFQIDFHRNAIENHGASCCSRRESTEEYVADVNRPFHKLAPSDRTTARGDFECNRDVTTVIQTAAQHGRAGQPLCNIS